MPPPVYGWPAPLPLISEELMQRYGKKKPDGSEFQPA